MFNLAELWGLRPDRSTRGGIFGSTPRRTRAISARQNSPLWSCSLSGRARGRPGPVRDRRHPSSHLHGVSAQRDHDAEVQQCRFRSRCLRLPGTKPGARIAHLGAPALNVLSRIERLPDNPWVISGKKPGARRTDLQPPWQRSRKRATMRLGRECGSAGRRSGRSVRARARPRAHLRRMPRARRRSKVLASRPVSRTCVYTICAIRSPPVPWPSAEAADDRQVASARSGPNHGALRPSGCRPCQSGRGTGLERYRSPHQSPYRRSRSAARWEAATMACKQPNRRQQLRDRLFPWHGDVRGGRTQRDRA